MPCPVDCAVAHEGRLEPAIVGIHRAGVCGPAYAVPRSGRVGVRVGWLKPCHSALEPASEWAPLLPMTLQTMASLLPSP